MMGFSIINVHSRYNYAVNLRKKLEQPVVIVPLLNGTVMQGSKGAVGNVTLPSGKFNRLLLSIMYCKFNGLLLSIMYWLTIPYFMRNANNNQLLGIILN